ncbi:hypothetical protein B0O99DRAFT_692540 [Bisporella sp. PMI_857]|nr:hypothetical protein B0O99DRAFT_692540 [Bisporella sp. PMI_857]
MPTGGSPSAGYPKLATFMASEGRYTMFRQFQELACQDLLHRQSELVHLENELRRIIMYDYESGRKDEEKLYCLDWRKLSTSAQRSQSKQWSKLLEIRDRLHQYYKTFLQYKQIFAEPHPELSDISLLREWIEKPSLGGGCGFFGLDLGTESPTVYDDQYKNDLMRVVGTRGEDDPFTKLITGRLFYIFDNILQFFKQTKPQDVEVQTSPSSSNDALVHYSDERILWVAELLGTVLAPLGPMSCIVILYFIQDLSTRLGVVCAFTVIFSAILRFATRARRAEVFAITAAIHKDSRKLNLDTNFRQWINVLSQYWGDSARADDVKDDANGNKLYAFTIEVEPISLLHAQQPVTAIALYHSGTKHDWVSKRYLEEKLNIKRYTSSCDVEDGETSRALGMVNLRWTCSSLSPEVQQTRFYIAPKADIDILFGQEHKQSQEEESSNVRHFTNKPSTTGNFDGLHCRSPLQTPSQLSFKAGIARGILIQVDQHPLEAVEIAPQPSLLDLQNELDKSLNEKSSTNTSRFSFDKHTFNTEDHMQTDRHLVSPSGHRRQKSDQSSSLGSGQQSRRPSDCDSVTGTATTASSIADMSEIPKEELLSSLTGGEHEVLAEHLIGSNRMAQCLTNETKYYHYHASKSGSNDTNCCSPRYIGESITLDLKILMQKELCSPSEEPVMNRQDICINPVDISAAKMLKEERKLSCSGESRS